MFEHITEAPQREGVRGFIGRHFGPVVDEELALAGIRLVTLVLLAVTGISGVVAWFQAGPMALVGVAILATPALVLLFTPSRVAAVVLALVTGLSAALAFPAILPWAWFLFAVRGIQLAFGYHRLRKARLQQPA